MENKIFKQEVEIIITPQAQKVIASSKYSLDEFKDWSLKVKHISFGGHNATEFLEAMYNKNEVKNDG